MAETMSMEGFDGGIGESSLPFLSSIRVRAAGVLFRLLSFVTVCPSRKGCETAVRGHQFGEAGLRVISSCVHPSLFRLSEKLVRWRGGERQGGREVTPFPLLSHR